MITRLQAGMTVVLPSGNAVVLMRREGAEWVCQYAPHEKARGEVEFSSCYLRKHGAVRHKEVTTC